MTRLDRAFALIDQANAEDPNRISIGDSMQPAERIYGERMSDMLAQHFPGASELLQIAARAQHIQRWKVPRTDYPDGRAGYHRWRNELKRLHAEWTAAILLDCGYSSDEAQRTGSLIRKENLKSDPETQALEDTACLVFLTHYASSFAAKHDEAKCIAILAKTWAKMSAEGRKGALTLDLPAPVRELLKKAVTPTLPVAENNT